MAKAVVVGESGLTAVEAAARLGVKRETIYAYVSRGLIARTVSIDGRTSLFDPNEIEALRLGRRAETDGELHTQITTSITDVGDHGLFIRGEELVALVEGGAGFVQVVDLLWESPDDERWPSPEVFEASPIDSRFDALRSIVAERSSADALRHDLSPRSVRAAGRSLITAMIHGLPVRAPGSDRNLVDALWRRLALRRGSKAARSALDKALSLLVDHGMASSTFAARIAASVRGDPYSVVLAGLGVLGGTLHGAASRGVHEMFVQAEAHDDAAAAVGNVRRQTGSLPGFGHTIYNQQDPRYGALMSAVVDAWSGDSRLTHVYRVRDVVAERSDEMPNVDLALGAMTYMARMPVEAGEVIFAIARTAGWLAHAMEEYDEKPLRFRPKARYLRS